MGNPGACRTGLRACPERSRGAPPAPTRAVILSEAPSLHAEPKDLGERPRRCATRASEPTARYSCHPERAPNGRATFPSLRECSLLADEWPQLPHLWVSLKKAASRTDGASW